MSKQSDYQSPLVDPEKKILRKLYKEFTGNFEILKHALVPHQHARLPAKKFTAAHFPNEKSYTFEIALEMYKESTKRIETLEEKGFKLLTYISAISAILIYFLSKDITGWFKASVILSLFFLTLAIIVSLRCISIKSQKVLFIDSLFNFETDHEPAPKDKKAVTAEILTCTVFNQTVADNTADILKGARILLGYGIFTTIISCVFFLAAPVNKEENKVYQTKVMLADSVLRKSIISASATKDTELTSLKAEIRALNQRLDSIKKGKTQQAPKNLKVPIKK